MRDSPIRPSQVKQSPFHSSYVFSEFLIGLSRNKLYVKKIEKNSKIKNKLMK